MLPVLAEVFSARCSRLGGRASLRTPSPRKTANIIFNVKIRHLWLPFQRRLPRKLQIPPPMAGGHVLHMTQRIFTPITITSTRPCASTQLPRQSHDDEDDHRIAPKMALKAPKMVLKAPKMALHGPSCDRCSGALSLLSLLNAQHTQLPCGISRRHSHHNHHRLASPRHRVDRCLAPYSMKDRQEAILQRERDHRDRPRD